MSMSRYKTGPLIRPLILILFAALLLIRIPSVVLEGGRFWAEEGVIYFHNAWYLPWYQAWFAIHTGYINFAAAFATWTAMHLGGIVHAPFVTVIIALLIQCLPVFVILTHDFPWRRSLLATILAASMCALQPLTGEVWLNTITSQFHLALCGALIFASPSNRPALFYTDCAILLLGSFSGPGTCFLFPLFALAAAFGLDKRAFIKVALVGLGFFTQLLMYLTHDTSIRGGRLDPDALLSVISLHTIALQFGGFRLANDFSNYLASAHSADHILWAGPLVFLLFYGLLAFAVWQTSNVILARLLAAGILISLISFYESLGGDFASFMTLGFGERYAFVPMAINGLLVVGLASASHRMMRGIFSAVLCIVIAIGIADYKLDTPTFNNGPPWGPQIQRWLNNSEIILFVWPDKNWPTRLTADHIFKAHQPKR